jgi:hypothetical protein
MSVSFIPAVFDDAYGHYRPMFPCACDDWCNQCQARTVNLGNDNARDLLAWLDIPATPELDGDIDARDLAARCRRRLWNEPRNHDAGVEGFVDAQAGRATLIVNGRSENYLRTQTERLLKIAELAGDHRVSWA